MRPALSLLDGLNRLVSWTVGLLFALATAAVLIQVMVRFALPPMGIVVSAPWTEECARYLVAWSVFLGVAVLCRDARLIAVEMLAFMLPRRVGQTVKLLGVVISMGFFAILLSTGIEWTGMSSIEASPVMRIPMSWIYASMPVGSALALLNLAAFLIESLTGRRDPIGEAALAAD
jgi:TRAP-type C4-dicarboxylate transport system permease small subunit